MSSKFYLVFGELLKPKIYRQLKRSQTYANSSPKSVVKAFDTENEALAHLNSILKPSSSSASQSEVAQQTESVQLSNDTKKSFDQIPDSIDDRSSISREDSIKNIIMNSEDLEESHANLQADKVIKKSQKYDNFDVFTYFSENEKMFEAAKSSIVPEDKYHLFFDGATKSNPGPSGCGYAVFSKDSEKIYQNAINVGYKTNNKSEYLGAIYGMKSCLGLGIQHLNVYGDSSLVVNQITGKFQVKSPALLDYHKEAKELKSKFASIALYHIARESNQLADSLANKGVKIYGKRKAEETSADDEKEE